MEEKDDEFLAELKKCITKEDLLKLIKKWKLYIPPTPSLKILHHKFNKMEITLKDLEDSPLKETYNFYSKNKDFMDFLSKPSKPNVVNNDGPRWPRETFGRSSPRIQFDTVQFSSGGHTFIKPTFRF